MRNQIKLALMGIAATAAAPALAQVDVGLGGQANVGVGAGVDAGPVLGDTLDTTRDTLDRTVDGVDRQANRALSSDAVLATSADLRTGATVRDNRGRRIGTVQSVEADSALVVQGNRQLRVPLSALYRTGSGLVTSLSRAEVRASANAGAAADVND